MVCCCVHVGSVVIPLIRPDFKTSKLPRDFVTVHSLQDRHAGRLHKDDILVASCFMSVVPPELG